MNLPIIYKPKVVFFFFFILLWSYGFTQTEKTFHLEFDANVREKKTAFRLLGANISVYKNGSLTQEVITDESGRYKFKLEPDADYELKFSKAGYVSKILSINTENVPPKD
ncbi:MAG: carboxypeptidase regulatory-like domain-containing protein, partial [Bacteroidota bacterium]